MGDIYYRTATLESIARKTLTQYDPAYLNRQPQAVPIEKIIEDVFGLNIEYMRLTIAGDELGRMIYDNGYSTRFNAEKDEYELVMVTAGTMLIESTLLKSPVKRGRYRFTAAHELAHWLLHKVYYTGTGMAAASYRTDIKADGSLEWQADYLATAILMPAGQVKRGFHQTRMEKSTDKESVSRLADIFEVSKQAMEIRLKDFKLIS